MHFRPLHIIVILFLLTPSLLASPHMIRNIGASEGLNDLLVNAIYEDPHGLMWLGTGSSLECFDGISMTHYDLPNHDTQQRVEAITGDNLSVYFCSNQSLYHLQRQTDAVSVIPTDEISGILRDLCLLDNRLYIATSAGLYIYDIVDRSIIRHILFNAEMESAPQNELRHIQQDARGNLWLTSKAGLHSLSTTGVVSNYYYSDLPQNGFTELTVADSVILIGSFHNGLYRFDITNAQFNPVYQTVSPVVSLQIQGDTLLAATDGDGVFLYSLANETYQHLSTATSLSSNSVYRALIDSRGIIWVGHYQHGLDYTLGQTEQFGIHHTDMLNTEGIAVRALAIHNQQRLIGTRQGLYFIDKQRHYIRTFTERDLQAKMIFSTLYHQDKYYVGTYGGGLYSLDTLGQNLRRIESPYIGNEIFSLCADPDGRLWVGSDIGVAVLQRDHVTRYFSAENSILPPGLAYCIYFDHHQRGWLCTAGGVVLYDAEADSLTTQPLPDDFPRTMMVRSIYNDRHDQLYFMPDKGQTYIVDSLLNPITVSPQLPEDNLFMIEDCTNQLWIGTKDGLYSLHDNNLHQYNFANGLPSPIFTLCQPQIDHEGTVWLGNSRGLIYLKPDSVQLRANHRSILITRYHLQNNALSIHFSDLRYSDPRSTTFEYWLEGEDDTWQTLHAQSQVSYSYLHAGRYRFHIRLAGEPDTETTLTIHVPISLRTWLLVFVFAFVFVIVIVIVKHLHGRVNVPDEQTHSEHDAEAVHSKYANVSIPVETLNELHQRIDDIMLRDKIYLRPDLKIAEIAQIIQVPVYQLSYLFTQHMQTTFYDYLYHFRIEEFKQRVQAGDIKRYTVESLAEQCGFSSRASFFRNFKKEVGMTPNEYIKTTKTTS